MNNVRVLFLCTGNSARSIIGEAILNELGRGSFDVYSAGTEPRGINPFTVKALAAQGIELGGATSKHVSQFEGEAFDYVITVCDSAAERCPVFPGVAERIHWSFEDPATVNGSDDEKLEAFNMTVHGMQTRVQAFIEAVHRRTPA